MKEFYRKFEYWFKERTTSVLIPTLLLLFLVVYLSQKIFITILPGEAGVFWSRFFGGTRVDYVYGEGMHYIFPWDKMYIYNVRVQQVAHDFDVLTKTGLKIHLYLSIRYFPELKLLGVLHQKVGPNYVETVVIPEIESVLRVLIGRMDAEEVYTTEKAIIEKAVNQAVEQIAQRFVNVDNVIIKRMEFPAFIAKAIEAKMEQQQIAQAYKFKIERENLEAERKRIEAGGFKKYNEIIASSLAERGEQLLRWRGIQATLELAKSNNSKVVVIGSGKDQFQLFGNIPLEPPSDVSFPNTTSTSTLGIMNVPEMPEIPESVGEPEITTTNP
jgi:regulator of protease activity HflC (stomatin/prohibitin superfamily)